ncbi:MAG TPA: NUDIX hydrolase, partial [Terrimesophilobacter sp.]|nr:NUDIX hydrolase [Terrimesophilobacter sp.]
VFPGGVVEPADRVDDEAHDAADLRTLQRAGARETHEETGLTVSPAALVHFATWHPPQHTGRRYLTTFFAANAPNAPIVPSPEEVADHRWLRPADALALHTEDRPLLIPPTWITLHSLTVDTSVNASLERLAAATAPHFSTRATADKRTLLWQGDVAYDDQTLLHTEGPHHRLRIDERPWVYERNL